MARFRISASCPLESRRLFVLAGEVVEGRVEPGMFVQIPFNREVSLTGQIQSIESVLHSGGREEVGLCIEYVDDDELELWKSLDIGSETIEVTPNAA